MDQDGKLDQGIEKRHAHIGVSSEGEEEQCRLLDLRIGLVLLGEEGRKQLLHYMRSLHSRNEEESTMRGRMPST